MEVQGRHLDLIYDVEHQFAPSPGVDLPDSTKLLNFEFSMGDKRWLYLDPYGDEILLREMYDRFFGEGDRESVAVCLDTGELAIARFVEDEGKLCLYVETLSHWAFTSCDGGRTPYCVPREFLPLLDGLRSMKRPFSMSICDHALFNFIDREIGYGQLREFLTITLDLRPKGYLEIWGDSYRWVSPWEREQVEEPADPPHADVVNEALEANQALLADGFEEALVGYVERFNSGPLALYDRQHCIRILMDRDGMTEEEADEFLQVNVIGAWVGDKTPAFATFED
jgi:hypothetical protein